MSQKENNAAGRLLSLLIGRWHFQFGGEMKKIENAPLNQRKGEFNGKIERMKIIFPNCNSHRYN